ncbi:MAG: hypothetical protein JNL84_03645 [Candidatus Accumulibacter sp.]|nr:hypothetical protein [Accumulibacter sp.]
MNGDPDLNQGVNPQNPAAAGAMDDNGQEAPRRLRRRRSFVASDVVRDADRIRARLADRFNDDDLPVLTEVVVEPDGRKTATGASTWASQVEQHLGAVLPGLLQSALADAGQRLQQQIEAEIAHSLRQFLSQHSVPETDQEPGSAVAADD